MPDVVDRLIGALNAHDLDAVMRCYVADAVVVGPEMGAENLDEIASYHLHIWQGFPDHHLTVWEKIARRDMIAAEVLATGTHTGPYLVAGGDVLEATGRSISVRGSWLVTVESDYILSQRVYFDQLELYTRLGAQLPLKFAPIV
ncbi:ester cyclase [Sphaerimonospora thailandensis]|uniref:Ketosteroid isomerase-like protein n=1 Tax=Sphaerimonospora thailandensis TaxID=795644 RepID=A0A8J3R915_9ACTN|nr:ester cyclase [Sphaerimonospora thailandensis]GIH70125.1 hypothetical protein Mth01_23780 [Sphaerimonospora thailandensis]